MSSALTSSIDPAEIEKFSAMAETWWDPTGPFAPLHQFNPVRLSFIRSVAQAHFGREGGQLSPFSGLSLLDLGCGGGLLCEPMSRLGFAVTGVDASEKNIHIAQMHAEQQDLSVAYRPGTAEILASEGLTFDVVLNMEVIEHVADPAAFLATLARLLAPGGVLFVSTVNRTPRAFLTAKLGAEYVLRLLPAGTHDYRRFVTPAELGRHLRAAGLRLSDIAGMAPDTLHGGWRASRDVGVNYIAMAEG